MMITTFVAAFFATLLVLNWEYDNSSSNRKSKSKSRSRGGSDIPDLINAFTGFRGENGRIEALIEDHPREAYEAGLAYFKNRRKHATERGEL